MQSSEGKEIFKSFSKTAGSHAKVITKKEVLFSWFILNDVILRSVNLIVRLCKNWVKTGF